MRIVMFYHSLLSDWNHGNAHFLRGVVRELLLRGNDVRVYEPADAWSVQNLLAEHGPEAIASFHRAFPMLEGIRYELSSLDLNEALAGADLVLVHEWNDHGLVQRIGQHRARRGNYQLLFHDTHHRAITQPRDMARYDLAHYDGVLAFGQVLRDLYLQRRWVRRAWTWHEAADVHLFHPIANQPVEGDLIWIGNWGDDERTQELHEFLFKPVRSLGLKARVHGVRYPDEAKAALARAGIEYRGWLANFAAPQALARFKVTVHVPRRPYVQALPGIPTIRVFEALACGIPLVCAPWNDSERLFAPGKDYLVAHDATQMKRQLKTLLAEPDYAREVASHGRSTILARHTCGHRVEELLEIVTEMKGEPIGRKMRRRPTLRKVAKWVAV